MAKSPNYSVEQIKKCVIVALASDDLLMETLVLKGGNAIALLPKQPNNRLSRTSYDLDFSMEDDFLQDLKEVEGRIEKTLRNTFSENGLVIFDFRFSPKPKIASDVVSDFWGGYKVEFKLTTQSKFNALAGDEVKLRNRAISVVPGGSPIIEIEISKYEYVTGKEERKLDGYTFYIYTPEMIAFEKVRAICQQLPDYASIVPSHSARPRARDFYDIYGLLDQFQIDPSTPDNKILLSHIFEAKRVPLSFIQLIPMHLVIHRSDWQNLLDTVSAREEVESFDFYATFVAERFGTLTFP